MARVTVEDCVLKIPNRFELVMLAAQRARNISAGVHLTVDRDNDKNPVVALREIADESVELDELESGLVKGLQKFVEMDEPEEEEVDLLAIHQALNGDLAEVPSPDQAVVEALSVHDDAAALDLGGEIMAEAMGMDAPAEDLMAPEPEAQEPVNEDISEAPAVDADEETSPEV